MTDDIDYGARMKADRKARGLSRVKYAELIGLTPAKVGNIEKGRAVKEDELPKLAFLAFTDEERPESTAGLQLVPDVAEEAGSTDDDLEERRTKLIERYTEVYALLDGEPSPIPYNLDWGSPGEGDPAHWDRILDWCDQVESALKSEAPTPPPLADDNDTAPEPEPVVVAEEDVDEELHLAVVVEPEEIFPDDGVKRVSNSELRTFKRCRRRWWLSYYRQLGLAVHAVTGPAPLGTRIHRCLSVFYVPADQEPGDPLEELERTFLEDMELVSGDELATNDLIKERDLAHAMLEGYLEWLEETAADQGIEVIASEQRVEADAKMDDADVHFIAKLDVRATRTFGSDIARVFIDHKTVGDLTSPTKMLQFDEQMLHYHLVEYLDLIASGIEAEEANSIRTDGALYNMLRKVKRTAAAKPPFYGRVEVRHNIETLRSYWMRAKGTIDEILELERKLDAGMDPRQVAYPTPTRDCSWDCDFYHVCTMFDDGSRAEDMLAASFVEIHPLKRYANPLREEV